MKRTELIIAALLALLTLTTASCQREEPQFEPEKPQKVSLTGTQWEFHDEQTRPIQGTLYTITDDMFIEFESDSSGYWETTTYLNGTNYGSLVIDFNYEFDGVSSGKITLSPESSPTPGTTAEYNLTYDAEAATILLEMKRDNTGNSYLFHKKQ